MKCSCHLWKNLLKYFFSIAFVVIAIIHGTDKLNSTISEIPLHNLNSETTFYYTDFSNSDLYLPYQTFSANILRLQNSHQRSNNTYKNHLKFAKIHKSIHISIKNFIQIKFSITHSPFAKTVHKLISFGKLII